MPSKGSEKYQEYMKSDDWFRRRAEAIRRARGRCQLCNSTGNLEAHHRTYERLGNEDPEDLTVLCQECHAAFHKRKDEKRRRAKEAASRKAAENGESKSARKRRSRKERKERNRVLTKEEVEVRIIRKKAFSDGVARRLRGLKTPIEDMKRATREEER